MVGKLVKYGLKINGIKHGYINLRKDKLLYSIGIHIYGDPDRTKYLVTGKPAQNLH